MAEGAHQLMALGLDRYEAAMKQTPARIVVQALGERGTQAEASPPHGGGPFDCPDQSKVRATVRPARGQCCAGRPMSSRSPSGASRALRARSAKAESFSLSSEAAIDAARERWPSAGSSYARLAW